MDQAIVVPDPVAGEGSARGFIRRHALRIANAAVLIVIAALLYRQINFSETRRALGDVQPGWVAAAVCLNAPVAALFALRSHFVLVRLGHRVEVRVLVPAMILGNVAGALTPASTGEILRAAALRSHAKIPAVDGIALVLFERGVSVYLMVLGTGVVAAILALSRGQALAVGAASIPLFLAPAFAPVLLRFIPPHGTDGRSSLASRAFGHVRDATGRLDWILRDIRLLLLWSFLTSLLFVLPTLQIWMLTRGIGHGVPPSKLWVAFGASQLAGIASLLPLGLGAADGSLAALLHRMGMTFEQGTAVAILVRATMTLPLGLMALASYLYLTRTSGRTAAEAPVVVIDKPINGG